MLLLPLNDLFICDFGLLMTTTIAFPDQHAFRQAAFDAVGRIVFQYGEQVIMSGTPAPLTEQCLLQLEAVCLAWGYNAAQITMFHDQVKEENAEIIERTGEWD